MNGLGALDQPHSTVAKMRARHREAAAQSHAAGPTGKSRTAAGLPLKADRANASTCRVLQAARECAGATTRRLLCRRKSSKKKADWQ